MKDYFGPRYVAIRDIPGWLREAWGLFGRKPVSFLALAGAYYFLADAARTLGAFALPFALLLCQIALFIGIVIAQAADTSKYLRLKPTWAMMRNVLWIQFFLAIIYTVFFIVSATLGALIEQKIPSARPHLFAYVKWMWPGLLAFLCLYGGLTALTQWLLAPLLALHEMGLRAAMSLARRAEEMNVGAFAVASYLPSFAYGLALVFLPDPAIIIGFVLLPLFAPFQYVVYRHIFLGRKQNQPLTSAATEARLSAHSA